MKNKPPTIDQAIKLGMEKDCQEHGVYIALRHFLAQKFQYAMMLARKNGGLDEIDLKELFESIVTLAQDQVVHAFCTARPEKLRAICNEDITGIGTTEVKHVTCHECLAVLRKTGLI